MGMVRKVWLFAFAGLNFSPMLLGGGTSAYPGHRTQLEIPMSGPFTTQEATLLPEWDQVRRMTELIKTDSGSLELFHETPLFEAKYADESYFLDLIRKWRDRIPTLPEAIDPAIHDGAAWVVLDDGASRTLSITFPSKTPANGITIMKVSWRGQDVSDLNFMSGFVNTVPTRRQHRMPSHRPDYPPRAP